MQQPLLKKKRWLMREDLNVPIAHNKVTSDARLIAALPSIQYALDHDAKVILCSHLGRPTEGVFDMAYSLAPVAKRLAELLGMPVRLIRQWQEPFDLAEGDVVLLENVRFNVGETSNDQALAKAYADLCDVFVMDAFATAHRAHASTTGVMNFAKVSIAGPLLKAELTALDKALKQPEHPVLAIVGGAKVSTKLGVLHSLAKTMDNIIVGGGIANTFIAAAGYNVGQSLVELDLISEAKLLMETTSIPLPVDVLVANHFSEGATATIKSIEHIADDEMIMDIGPETAKRYAEICHQAKTILWNGPLGVFEWQQFSEGTKVVADAIAASSAFSVAGGGDTIAALEKFGVSDSISVISTGGGAFLTYLEGKPLPALEVLNQKQKESQSL